ncbi:hypothetical protein ACS0ZG_12210 [Burkholderia gladioli]|uniref:Uncharacterized protein n=2 Tax=Burkholderia gladioli TaxID=28095 RepID=A0A2A7SBU9_BURGA|nr:MULTISPECIES: hypothetical protein [Burkholderia]ATF89258.1 hypothetical protein CO712_30410 [Burkholderia gladioli pv. gladioli]MBJ9712381.1 hypothetical protein [Burkholderia gladioli]MBU9153349.1 hypothetical protein [Burkholderia gladioli]MBU9167565.1 hypothetical protein [Burkholderia gladioli]MBU9196386.1 hypothetical protein [Burkholderia gladioli]
MDHSPAGKPALMKYVTLLYFLVVAQLAAKRQLDSWLPVAQLVALLHHWIDEHQMKCDWRDRIWLGKASLEVARSVHAAYGPAFVVPFLSTVAESRTMAGDAREKRSILRTACFHYLTRKL